MGGNPIGLAHVHVGLVHFMGVQMILIDKIYERAR